VRNDGDIDLDALFVEPGTWRQGIGRRLVHHCEEAARRVGARALHVIGNHTQGIFMRQPASSASESRQHALVTRLSTERHLIDCLCSRHSRLTAWGRGCAEAFGGIS
jgi:GNAT superfamily N-acetyltransferase